ncbi:hypothetical protein DICPUDRAFT_155242 [Dictyostelium purpureum]|uniref:Uncharacterized protein n=1 Tax=Dictyostelium purpureum TaxID=5786 RepID=F0ZTF9_DICPU|nr:uncharacterized protein DICPUDRAFT_155242 [Dictyostelium purpureum]EGC32776.1 hypothetical protein DICPUDRAFT_155242 [Dictyostelium purpureum]|eukprot:XP_003290699.1 hypothetical protein DICPUDRAFT_155242 [Dictyostelium purpureum]
MKLKSILILVLIIVFSLFISGGWGQTYANSNSGLTASGGSTDSHGSSNGNYTSSEGSHHGNYTSSEGSHHGNHTSSEGSHHGSYTSSEGLNGGGNNCPYPNDRNSTTNDNAAEFVSISLCSDDKQCTDIVRRRMKVGEVVKDSNNNSFVYVGDHKVCYSVYYSRDGCLGGDGTSRCENYCFQATPKTNNMVIVMREFLNYYCSQYLKTSYYITIGEPSSHSNSFGDSVSSSTKIKPTILLGLSILLIMFGLYN